MNITFDRGDQSAPKGHALLYFRSGADASEVWATYVVILPIAVDVSKYVPPFLMNQVNQSGPVELSAFAFPPAPERLNGYEVIEDLAARRDDDILYCGTLNPGDVPGAMMAINEAVQAYADKYGETVGIVTPGEEGEAEEDDDSGLGVNEVLYGLMDDADRLGELTKLVGRLKFAVEGADNAEAREAEREMRLLARHLPSDHQVLHLVEAVKSSDSRGAALADLYLQRCYHLVNEDYRKMADIDKRLAALGVEGAERQAP